MASQKVSWSANFPEGLTGLTENHGYTHGYSLLSGEAQIKIRQGKKYLRQDSVEVPNAELLLSSS